jgi:hypothetical protein
MASWLGRLGVVVVNASRRFNSCCYRVFVSSCRILFRPDFRVDRPENFLLFGLLFLVLFISVFYVTLTLLLWGGFF